MSAFVVILPALLLLLSLGACEKKNDSQPETEKSKLLMNGVWKLVRVGIDSNMNNQLSLNEISDTLLRVCERDNKLDFQSGNRLLKLDEGVSCGPSTVIGHRWYLRENETVLEIESYAGWSLFTRYSILALTQNKLWIAGSNGPSPAPQSISEYER